MNPHRQLGRVPPDLRTKTPPWSLGQLFFSIVVVLAVISLYAMTTRADERAAQQLEQLAHGVDATPQRMPLEIEWAYQRGVDDAIVAMQDEFVQLCISAAPRCGQFVWVRRP